MYAQYKIGNALIQFSQGFTEITLNNGSHLMIPWTSKGTQDLKQAQEIGYTAKYSDDEAIMLMNKDHDPLHVLVAHTLQLPDSQALVYASGGPLGMLWRYEEACVFSFQSYLAVSGIKIEQLLLPFKI